jgi:hypothetical protein
MMGHANADAHRVVVGERGGLSIRGEGKMKRGGEREVDRIYRVKEREKWIGYTE